MGKTIMVSSHILPELADICNKIGIIERGELLICAEVSEVMRQVRRRTVLNVAVADNQEAAAQLLEDLPTVEQSRTRDDILVVTLAEGIDDYSTLPTTLVNAGYQVDPLQRR